MCGSCWFMDSLKVNVWNIDQFFYPR
jgi:hypothetical protein